MLSAMAEKDARLLFLLLFVVKPCKVHPGPHDNGLSGCQACMYFKLWSRQFAQSLV